MKFSLRQHGLLSELPFLRHAKSHHVFIALTVLSFFVTLHIFRFPDDFAVESEITYALANNGVYRPSKYFYGVTHVCFLPSYQTMNSSDISLSDKSIFELNMKMNYFIGRSDTFWWIVGVKDNEVEFLYKISGRIRQFPNQIVCAEMSNFHLLLDRQKSTGKTLFFQIK
jgi:hypothetical protein